MFHLYTEYNKHITVNSNTSQERQRQWHNFTNTVTSLKSVTNQPTKF